MGIEYVPYKEQPDIRFEFEISEMNAYFAEYIADLETAPENHSPHKQIVRDYRELVTHLLEIQAKLHHTIKNGIAEVVHWDEITGGGARRFIANVLEYGYGVVSCPFCQEVYSGSEILAYDWHYSDLSGRLFTCPLDHELLNIVEKLGAIMEPPDPYVRTPREKRAR